MSVSDDISANWIKILLYILRRFVVRNIKYSSVYIFLRRGGTQSSFVKPIIAINKSELSWR